MEAVKDYFVGLFSGGPLQITGQICGLVAMVIAIVSFQMKTQKTIVLLQLFSSFLFSLQFVFLGAYMGMMLNVLSVVRSVIFSQRTTKKWAAGKIWILVFCIAFITTYPVIFLVFKKEPTVFNLIIELLPALGMVASTFAFHAEKAKYVRLLYLISSPPWLAYNIANGAFGGMINEVVVMISIILAIIRLDIGKKSPGK